MARLYSTLVILAVFFRCFTHAWILDEKSCITDTSRDFKNDVLQGMKQAFTFNEAAINALNSLENGGDMNDPTYRAQVDLLQYLFNNAIKTQPNTIDTSDTRYARVKNTFTRVQGFKKTADGSDIPRPQGDLPADDVIVYCSMDGATELGKNAEGERTIKFPDTDIEWALKDKNMENEWDSCKPNSKGNTMAIAFDNKDQNKISQIFICSWYLRYIDGKHLQNLNDVSLRAIFAKPSLSILKALKIITVIDIASAADMGHTMLHELTHAIKDDPTRDLKAVQDKSSSAYGWKNCMINSPYGPNDLTMDRGLGWCNADSYAFFGMGASLISPGGSGNPQRVNEDGSIVVLPQAPNTNTKRSFLKYIPRYWRQVQPTKKNESITIDTPAQHRRHWQKRYTNSSSVIVSSSQPVTTATSTGASRLSTFQTSQKTGSSTAVISISQPVIPAFTGTDGLSTTQTSTRTGSSTVITSASGTSDQLSTATAVTTYVSSTSPSLSYRQSTTTGKTTTPASSQPIIPGTSTGTQTGTTGIISSFTSGILQGSTLAGTSTGSYVSETITTGSTSTVVPITVIPVVLSGKTSSVTYVSTSTSSGTIGPTGAWMCQGDLCDIASSCIIPIFCSNKGGSGASWGLCCGWEPIEPDGQSPPAGGPSPGPPQGDDNNKPTQTQKSQTETSTGSTTSTHSSTASSTTSCSMQTASSCEITVSIFTPSGVSSATTSTLTGTCSTTEGCSVTGTTVTTTSSSSAAATETPIIDDFGDYGNVDFFDQAWSIISVLETNTDAPAAWTNTASGGGSTTPTSRPSISATTASATQSNTITSSGIFSATSVPSQLSTSTTETNLSASITYSCAMTSMPLTTTSGVTYSTGTYCTCNDGAFAGVGSTIGTDQYTTYICETGLRMPIATVAPTNVPGKGGLPGCAAVVAVTGTSAYCNCGGTPAPTLSPTPSGLMNCAYTIQPTSSYDPAVPPSTTSIAPSFPYATGECNAHIWQGIGQEYTDPAVAINVNITDANGNQIGHNASALGWGETLGTDSELPWVLLVTPQTGMKDKRSALDKYIDKRLGGPTGIRPLFEHGPVNFAYSGQSWDTSSSQCSVGGWDNGNANDFFGALIFGDDFVPNRQMDCKFTCP